MDAHGFAHTFTLHQRFSINRNKNRIIFLMQSELRIFVPALSAYENLCFLFQKYLFLSDPLLKMLFNFPETISL